MMMTIISEVVIGSGGHTGLWFPPLIITTLEEEEEALNVVCITTCMSNHHCTGFLTLSCSSFVSPLTHGHS